MGRKKLNVEVDTGRQNAPIAPECWRKIDCVPMHWRRPAVVPSLAEIACLQDLEEARILHLYYRDMAAGDDWRRIFSSKEDLTNLLVALEARRLRDDRRFMLEKLMVQCKDGPLVHFVPTPPQEMVINAVAKQMYLGEPVRVKVLKCRQWGASTIAVAILYVCHSLNPHMNGMIISNTDTSAEWINGIYRRFWRLDKRPGRPDATPNKEGLQWDEAVGGGGISITSARFFESALSQTRQYALFDEAAFYRNFRTFMGAAMHIIPSTESSMVFVVSTPHGLESDFHKFWQKPGDGYEKVFVPWFIVPEYTLPFKYEHDLTDFQKRFGNEPDIYGDEDVVKEKFGLDWERMHWRRRTIDEKCQGNLDTFAWMYPATEEEGFLGGGRKFFWFDTAAMYNWAKEQQEKILRFDIRFEYDPTGVVNGSKLEPDRRGRLHVIEAPRKEKHYLLGVDPAGGELVDIPNKEPDRSVVHVLKRGNPKKFEATEQVAVWAGHIAPDLLAWVCRAISVYYHDAWICGEDNNHGGTVVKKLEETPSRKRMMEKPNLKGGVRMDILKPVKPKRYWITTTAQSRMFMLDELHRGLREGDLKVFELDTLKESETFLVNDDGKPEAQSGCFDDRIMALAIGFTAHSKGWIPPMSKYTKGESETADQISFFGRLKKLRPGQEDPESGWNRMR